MNVSILKLLDRILALSKDELDLIGETTSEYYRTYLSPQGVALHITNFIERFNKCSASA